VILPSMLSGVRSMVLCVIMRMVTGKRLVALGVLKKQKKTRVKAMKSRLLYLALTVYALGFVYYALQRISPMTVQAYQPITTAYYVLGGVCLLVQLIDYVKVKRGNKDE